MTCNACGHFVREGEPCAECAGHASDVCEGTVSTCERCGVPVRARAFLCDACEEHDNTVGESAHA
jgi:hypothetical protein